MNDDELYELAKERIANDNGKRYSQEEIMEEFEIDEDDDFYEEKPQAEEKCKHGCLHLSLKTKQYQHF